MDIEDSVEISQYFVPIPDSVKRELEQLRVDNAAKDMDQGFEGEAGKIQGP